MHRTRQNGRGKRRTLSSSLFLLLALLVVVLWGGAKNNAARGDDRYEEELEYTGEEHSEETRNERVPSARGETSRSRFYRKTDRSSVKKKSTSGTQPSAKLEEQWILRIK